MPQKQPLATTAVCSALAVASVASTAGLGMVAPGRSPALQATTPAKVTIKSTVDTRERKLDIDELLWSARRPRPAKTRLKGRARRPSSITLSPDSSRGSEVLPHAAHTGRIAFSGCFGGGDRPQLVFFVDK